MIELNLCQRVIITIKEQQPHHSENAWHRDNNCNYSTY